MNIFGLWILVGCIGLAVDGYNSYRTKSMQRALADFPSEVAPIVLLLSLLMYVIGGPVSVAITLAMEIGRMRNKKKEKEK